MSSFVSFVRIYFDNSANICNFLPRFRRFAHHFTYVKPNDVESEFHIYSKKYSNYCSVTSTIRKEKHVDNKRWIRTWVRKSIRKLENICSDLEVDQTSLETSGGSPRWRNAESCSALALRPAAGGASPGAGAAANGGGGRSCSLRLYWH